MAQTVLISDCALAYVKTQAGGYSQVFYGDPVPAGYDGDDVQRLLDEGFLREATQDELGGLVALQDVPGGQVPGGSNVDAATPEEGKARRAPRKAAARTRRVSHSEDVPDSVGDHSTHAQLDAYAKANSVDLGDASTKAEKLDAINAKGSGSS